MTPRLARRTLLRGAAGAAVALPLLEAMLPRRAVAAPPRRFVVFFESNGVIKEHWTPRGGERDFELGRIHKALAAHRNDLVFISGLDSKASLTGPGSDHVRGLGAMLTGAPMQTGTFVAGSGFRSGYADGISVDQKIAGAIGGGTKLRSLELGIQVDPVGHPENRMVFLGPGQPVMPINDPAVVFDRLFADLVAAGGAAEAELQRRRELRRSVLDATLDEYRALQRRLGGTDRQKLDAHLTAIRDIEARLDARPVAGATIACTKPAAPRSETVTCRDQTRCGTAKLIETGRAQMDLLAVALACDLTRVASLQWSNCGNRLVYGFLGISDGHHDLGHVCESSAPARESMIKIATWYAEQLAYLLDRLKQQTEAGGTLLDSTLVLWCNELSSAHRHTHTDMAFLIAGRAGGALRTGRSLQYKGIPHNNLLVSCMNAMGVPGDTFGHAAFCTGPLSGL